MRDKIDILSWKSHPTDVRSRSLWLWPVLGLALDEQKGYKRLVHSKKLQHAEESLQ